MLAFTLPHSPTLGLICSALTLTASLLVPGDKEPVSSGWPAAYSSLESPLQHRTGGTWDAVVPFSCDPEFDQQDVDNQTLQIVAVQCAGPWALGLGETASPYPAHRLDWLL